MSRTARAPQTRQVCIKLRPPNAIPAWLESGVKVDDTVDAVSDPAEALRADNLRLSS